MSPHPIEALNNMLMKYFFCCFCKELNKDAVEEMLTADDDETADALAEFDFVMGEDSEGSETDVTVIEVDDNVEMLENVDIAMPEEPEYSVTQGTKFKYLVSVLGGRDRD